MPETLALPEAIAPSRDISTLRLLEINAYACYMATLVGNPAPKVKALYDRMSKPIVGDIVMEVSTIWHQDRVGTRIGRLVRIAQEPICSAEEWAEGGGAGEPVPTERVYYIELSDGREYRWHNATFIAIADKLGGFNEQWHSNEIVDGPRA